MVALGNLGADLLGVSDQRIVCGALDACRVDGALQGLPVLTQSLAGLGLGGHRALLWAQSGLLVDEHKDRARHVATLPRATVGVVGLGHSRVGVFDDLGLGDAQVEDLHGRKGVQVLLELGVVAAHDAHQQLSAPGGWDDLEHLKVPAVWDLDALGAAAVCGLHLGPVFITAEVGPGEDSVSDVLARQRLPVEQAQVDLSRFLEDQPAQGGPCRLFNGVPGHDAAGAVHELEASGGEADVQAALLGLVQTVLEQEA